MGGLCCAFYGRGTAEKGDGEEPSPDMPSNSSPWASYYCSAGLTGLDGSGSHLNFPLFPGFCYARCAEAHPLPLPKARGRLCSFMGWERGAELQLRLPTRALLNGPQLRVPRLAPLKAQRPAAPRAPSPPFPCQRRACDPGSLSPPARGAQNTRRSVARAALRRVPPPRGSARLSGFFP